MLGDYLFGYKNKKIEVKPAPTQAEIIDLLNQENEKTLVDVEYVREKYKDKGIGAWEGLFYFFFPFFGIICAITNKDSNPVRSKEATQIVLLSFGLVIFLVLMITVLNRI